MISRDTIHAVYLQIRVFAAMCRLIWLGQIYGCFNMNLLEQMNTVYLQCGCVAAATDPIGDRLKHNYR